MLFANLILHSSPATVLYSQNFNTDLLYITFLLLGNSATCFGLTYGPSSERLLLHNSANDIEDFLKVVNKSGRNISENQKIFRILKIEVSVYKHVSALRPRKGISFNLMLDGKKQFFFCILVLHKFGHK